MDDEVTFEITIPSDGDGFVLMQCEYCGVFFNALQKILKAMKFYIFIVQTVVWLATAI